MQRSTAEALGITAPGAEEQATRNPEEVSGSGGEQPRVADGSDRFEQGSQLEGDVAISDEAVSAILPAVQGPAFQILPLAICS
jgi:hypothetical protein